MKKVDVLIEEIKRLQAELDHRTKVEEQAIALITECRFNEANALLATLNPLEKVAWQQEGEEADQQKGARMQAVCNALRQLGVQPDRVQIDLSYGNAIVHINNRYFGIYSFERGTFVD